MLFMILISLVMAPSAAPAEPMPSPAVPDAPTIWPFDTSQPSKDCPDLSPRITEERIKGARLRRLDELPPGRLELAVMRQVDGCVIPAVVRDGIGNDGSERDRR